MNYRIHKIEADRAWEHALEYPYALVYMISETILCRTQDLPCLDWSECLEARFFGPDRELHIYEEDGSLQGVRVTEEDNGSQGMQIADKDDGLQDTLLAGEDGADCIDRRYQLAKRFRGAGTLLRVREYLSYDEDGQAYVSLTRLAGIEEV